MKFWTEIYKPKAILAQLPSNYSNSIILISLSSAGSWFDWGCFNLAFDFPVVSVGQESEEYATSASLICH